MRQENQFQTGFCFLKSFILDKSKWSAADFTIFRQPLNQHTIETNCSKLYTIDSEICSILIFQIRVWEQFFQPAHFVHDFLTKMFITLYSINPLSASVAQKLLCKSIDWFLYEALNELTDQISLRGCCYFFRYWAIYITMVC